MLSVRLLDGASRLGLPLRALQAVLVHDSSSLADYTDMSARGIRSWHSQRDYTRETGGRFRGNEDSTRYLVGLAGLATLAIALQWGCPGAGWDQMQRGLRRQRKKAQGIGKREESGNRGNRIGLAGCCL